MDRWAAVIELGRRQHGPVAVRQAVGLGVPRTTFADHVRREGWERPFPGVAVLPGARLDHRVRARAAALAVGAGAVVTGPSALHLHGIVDEPPVRVDLVVGATRRARELDKVRIARSRTLREDDHAEHDGVRVAGPPRAVLDAARRAGTSQLRGWLTDGRQRRLLDVAEVAGRAARAVSARGRGRVLAACAEVGASGADSILVAEVERRLLAEGFHIDVPPRAVEVVGRTLHPDLTLCGLPVGIEVDGFGTHSSRAALDIDQRKHNAYALVGWVMLRVGWTRMSQDWDGFVSELRAAVRVASTRAAATTGTDRAS